MTLQMGLLRGSRALISSSKGSSSSSIGVLGRRWRTTHGVTPAPSQRQSTHQSLKRLYTAGRRSGLAGASPLCSTISGLQWPWAGGGTDGSRINKRRLGGCGCGCVRHHSSSSSSSSHERSEEGTKLQQRGGGGGSRGAAATAAAAARDMWRSKKTEMAGDMKGRKEELAQDAREVAERLRKKGEEAKEQLVGRGADLSGAAREKVREGHERLVERGEEVKDTLVAGREKLKEGGEHLREMARDKVKEGSERWASRRDELRDRAKDRVTDAAHDARENMSSVKDRLKERGGDMKDRLKEKGGDMVKEATTQVRDSVVAGREKVAEKAEAGKNTVKWIFKKYGLIALGTYVTVYAGTLSSVYAVLQLGVISPEWLATGAESATQHVQALMCYLPAWAEEKGVKWWGTVMLDPTYRSLALAWIATKVTEPARILLTIAVVPRVARFFKRKS